MPPLPTDMQISSVEWSESPRTGAVLVGCCASGESACIFVTGCPNYFYVLPPATPAPPDVDRFAAALNCAVGARMRDESPAHVMSVVVERRTPADHYRAAPCAVLLVRFSSQRASQEARRLLADPCGWEAPPRSRARCSGWPGAAAAIMRRGGAETGWHVPTAEAVVEPAARTMVDAGLCPEDWLAWPADARPVPRADRLSTCVREVHVDFAKLRRMRQPERTGYAPKKMLAMSAQLQVSPARCLAVSLVTCRLGVAGGREEVTYALGDSCADEAALFAAVAARVAAEDPDVIMGHGTHRQTLGWLQTAAERVGTDALAGWGRLRAAPDVGLRPDRADEGRMSVHVSGRTSLDLEMSLQSSMRLRDFSLHAAAAKIVPDSARGPEAGAGAAALRDARLVMDLALAPSFAPLNKLLSYAAVTGAPISEAFARGTQHVQRAKLLRYAAARAERFVLLDDAPQSKRKRVATPSPERARAQNWMEAAGAAGRKRDREAAEEEEPGGVRFKGGLVQRPQPGLYSTHSPLEARRGATAVVDFGSLYPSIMCADNMCVTTRMTLEEARAAGVAYGDIIPMPWFEGAWVDAAGAEHELGEGPDGGTIQLPDGRRARLRTDEYGRPDGMVLLVGDDGEVWERAPRTVMVFVTPATLRGMLPGMLTELKAQREACRTRSKEAEKEGRMGDAMFWDGLQNAIKVLMNGAYGGLGASRGGVFQGALPVAAAVTSKGRHLITWVARGCEQLFWTHGASDSWGIRGTGEPAPPDATPVRAIYGDTDSAFIFLPGVSMATANKVCEAIAAHFTAQLPRPHVLEKDGVFSVILIICPKCYSALGAKGRKDRGMAMVRLDNVLSSVEAQSELVDAMHAGATLEAAAELAARLRRRLDVSLAHVYDAAPPPDCLPLTHFIQTSELTKPLVGAGAYKARDASPALTVARGWLRADPAAAVGMGTRVPFVIAAGTGGLAARALDPAAAAAGRVPLDRAHYLDRMDSVLATALAPLYADRAAGVRTASLVGGAATAGVRMEVRKGDRGRAPGQAAALSALAAALAPAAARDPPPPGPQAPLAHRASARRGVQMVSVEVDAAGVAWARGDPLGPLAWPERRWQAADGRAVKGRASSPGDDWRAQLAAAYGKGWVVAVSDC